MDTSTRAASPLIRQDGLPHLLTVAMAAELLQTSREALYARIGRGGMPGVIRDGRRLLIDTAILMGHLDRCRASSPQEDRR